MENKEKSKEVDLLEYWRIILGRKWVVITFMGLLLLFTGIFSFLATPLYKSTTTILIEEESSKILSFDATFGNQQPRLLQDLRNYNTQLKLLKSVSLVDQVVRNLNLLGRPEFGAGKTPARGLVASVKYLITLKWLSGKKLAEKTEGPLVRADPYLGLANSLLSNIEVKPIRETKLVEVSFTSSSPTFAAEFLNALAKEFVNFSVEKRYSTTQQASNFLDEQIAELRNLEGDAVPQFISDPAIQELKTEYTRLRAEYEEKRGQMKADHPEMMRIQARLNSLKDEINKAADTAEAKYKAALNKEGSIRATLERQRSDVAKMNSNAIFYNNLKIEVESKRKQLNTITEKRDETRLSAQLRGLDSSNISIIDRAEVPKWPASPHKTKNLLMALLVGMFGGVGLCFFFDYLDDTLKRPDDVQRLVNLPSLGVIPYLPPEGLKNSRGYRSYYGDRSGHSRANPEKEHTLPEVKEIELINYLNPDFPLAEDYVP